MVRLKFASVRALSVPGMRTSDGLASRNLTRLGCQRSFHELASIQARKRACPSDARSFFGKEGIPELLSFRITTVRHNPREHSSYSPSKANANAGLSLSSPEASNHFCEGMRYGVRRRHN